MKKGLIIFLPWLFTAFSYKAMAQEEPNKKETEEIIIRKKGQKDATINVQITGDKVLINGKPLVEFKDNEITVNKRKIIIHEGDRITFGDENGDFGNGSMDWSNDDDEKRTFLGVSTEKTDQGARIIEVTKESAAALAGLEKGDIITKFGDRKIDGPQSLYDAVTEKKAKDEVKIYYKRNGKEKSVKAILQERQNIETRSFSFSSPDGSHKTFTMPHAPRAEGLNGMNLEDLAALDTEISGDFNFNSFPRRQKLGLKIQDTEEGTGVKILEVEDSSAAAISGLKMGDVITEIGNEKVTNTDEAREQLQENNEKSAYKIKARRNGTEMIFDIKIPKKLKTANL